ncbi:glutamic-type intramembrane protease PrsW [Anoxybacillus kestanbolensis]|uniref:glutamic-type intramembrane protease PrsW n=1 Tax=Anoxybacillus kestanbolensis TaxID=227476 RepID=UPI003D206D54
MWAIISAGIAPGLALLSYFYLKDEYETEPLSLVLRMFLYGMFLVFPLMFIQHVLKVEHMLPNAFVEAFLSTSLLEEFFKWFVFYYAIYDHREFNEPYDGIVYGVSVSLGFATLENILYLFANGVEFAVTRALLPVSSHALFGVIMGFYLGKAKFGLPEKEKNYIWLSFLLPFVFHGIYDYILLTQQRWIYYMLPFMIFLWWLALRKVKLARGMTINMTQSSSQA